MRANYDERHRLLDHQYRTVYLGRNSKVPSRPGWQLAGGSLFDIEEETGADPYGNVGVVTGTALDGTSFFVLDVDSRELYEELRINTDTTIVETRRGFHLWYRGVMGNRQGLGGLKLDVRGNGGYATSPFSRVNGFTYRWVTALREPTKLAEWDPAWFPEVRREPQPRPPPSSLVRDPVSQRTVEWARSVLRDEYYSIEGCGGDTGLFKAACFLIQRARLDFNTAYALIQEWNHNGVNVIPPWDGPKGEERIRYKLREAQRLMK